MGPWYDQPIAQPYRAWADIPAMGRRCLDRQTLLVAAAGKCPREKLPAIRRHIGKCFRCRDLVARVASGERLGDTVEQAPPGVLRCRTLKTLLVLVSMIGIVFALPAAGPIDEPHRDPVTPQATVPVTAAVPAPTTTATQVPAGSPSTVDVLPASPPTAARVKCPPIAARIQTPPPWHRSARSLRWPS